ncbi:hypothetical protein EVA_02750 [gut metagenome]|uniref:Uncharacterized protein n=1 Tax=gut metagenome TaxID=749906 RepID=J9H0I1_9ZZZZ
MSYKCLGKQCRMYCQEGGIGPQKFPRTSVPLHQRHGRPCQSQWPQTLSMERSHYSQRSGHKNHQRNWCYRILLGGS